ncbi:hypothetical protein ACQ4PT_059540 [Festuca glaucescens]
MNAAQLSDGMRPGKKPKNTEAPSAAEMDDLQDDVLPSIVSFLPAHDAVRTCVLARRWRHVWTSATALRITAVGDFRSADKFNRFVDRLLSLRRHAHPPLESCEFDLVEKKFGFGWFLSVQHVYRHSLQSALDCNVKLIFQRDLSWRPTFPMLKTLVLDDWCLDDDLSEVILFIQQSPNLEKLTLELVEDFDSSMAIEGNYRSWDGTFASDHLKMVEIKCEKVDERINKVLKILSTFGISLEKIYIRQTDTSSGSECFHFVCTCISLN